MASPLTPEKRLRIWIGCMNRGPGRERLERALEHFGPPVRVYRHKIGVGPGIWYAWEAGLILREDGTAELERDTALYAEYMQ